MQGKIGTYKDRQGYTGTYMDGQGQTGISRDKKGQHVLDMSMALNVIAGK